MKLKTTILSMLLIGSGLTAMAQEPQTTRFDCVADGWLRTTNTATSFNTSGTTVELGTDDVAGEPVKRVALFGFKFSIPSGMKVESATLYIVSERRKGGQVELYGYPDFSESSNYATEWPKATATFEQDPILTFVAAGQNDKTISQVSDENYQSLDSWTNKLDVSSYVKSLPSSATMASFMLAGTGNNNNRFFTKENTGATGALGIGASLTADQLMPYLEVTFVEDAAQTTTTYLPMADTYVRGDTKDHGGEATMEINGNDFVGLMRFAIPDEVLDTDKYELSSATLRLVTVQNKSDRKFNIYNYGNEFAENTNANIEADFVTAALATDPIATFSANGLGGFAMGDNRAGNWANYLTVAAWTNYIDLTKYVTGKIEDGSNSFNILLQREVDNSQNKMKIATKESVDIVNSGENANGGVPFTFKAEDLVPQLTIVYVKKEAGEDPGEEPEEPEEPEQPEDTGIAGDANNNGRVTVADIIHIANYIAKIGELKSFNNANVIKETEEGQEERVDGADLAATIDIALGIYEPAQSRRLANESTATDRLVVDNFNAASEQPMTLAVKLDTENTFLTIQGTILLPEGMTYNNCVLGQTLSSSHNLVANESETGCINFVIYSDTNAPVNANEDSLLTLNVTATDSRCGGITISDIEAYDASYKRYYLTSDGGQNENYAAGVEATLAADDNSAEFYTLQGVKVNNPQKGMIYIKVLNGKAVKVIK